MHPTLPLTTSVLLAAAAGASAQTLNPTQFVGHGGVSPDDAPVEPGRVALIDPGIWSGGRPGAPSGPRFFPVFNGPVNSFGYDGPWTIHLGDFAQERVAAPANVLPLQADLQSVSRLEFDGGDYTLTAAPYVSPGMADPFVGGASSFRGELFLGDVSVKSTFSSTSATFAEGHFRAFNLVGGDEPIPLDPSNTTTVVVTDGAMMEVQNRVTVG
ncbi:MAG: hypothetical protein AAF561_14305 [Planctomycetota bacterium]